MEKDEKPIQVIGGAQTENGWDFHTPHGTIEVDELKYEINLILSHANGLNKKEDIIKHLVSLGIDGNLINALIDDLEEAGILTDSRD